MWTNLQYDVYKSKTQILKSIHNENTCRLQFQLSSQGFVISFVLENYFRKLNSLGSNTQSKLPTNILIFNIKYLKSTFATRKILYLWHLSAAFDCSFCLPPVSLLRIIAGCKTYLNEGRFTWRHNSALKLLTQTLQSIRSAKPYVGLPGYLSLCIITGDNLRRDILYTADNILYAIELTAGFKTNLKNSV